MARNSLTVIQEFTEACNAHDIERIAGCFAPNFQGLDVAEARPQSGVASVRQSLARYLAAFPNFTYFQEEVIIQGKFAAVIWRAQGTHQGPWGNIPPTGRTVVVRGMTRFTIENGKITRALAVWDVAGLLRAIGLLPNLA